MLSERRPTPATMKAVHEIASNAEPWLSVLLPTARSGPETQASRTALRNLITLAGEGPAGTAAAAILEEVAPLSDATTFWQHQDLGLAIYANGREVHLLSTPHALSPEVAWGTPRTRPVIEAATQTSDVGPYAVVLVGRDRVQLFAGDASGLTELDHGPVPAREDDLASDRDHQQSLQQAPQGGGEMSFHSHGADRPAARIQVERFIRAVADGLGRHPRIAAVDTVLLAGVEETTSFLRGIWQDQRVLDATIPGVVDRTSAHDLHDSAVELLRERGAVRRGDLTESFRARQGTGLAITALPEILEAAATGRIEALFVSGDQPSVESRDVSEDPVDRAVSAGLAQGGSILPVSEGLDAPEGCAALLRY